MDDTRYTETEAVVVIACTAAKGDAAAPAADLYRGQTFGLALAAALAETDNDTDRVLILSARYGLIRLTKIVEPYDTKLGDADAIDAADVTAQALDLGLADRTDVYAMLPAAYLDLLSEALQTIGTYPMDSFESARGIGDQRHVMSHSINQEDDQR